MTGTVVPADRPVGAEVDAGWRGFGDLVVDRARRHPERAAFVRLASAGAPEEVLSYGALARRAGAIAAELRRRLAPGTPVLLVFPNETGFVPALFGCFLAGMPAVPAAPPRNAAAVARLRHLGATAGAGLAIVSDRLRGRLEKLGLAGDDARAGWLFAGELPEGAGGTAPHEAPERNAAAILQFTSGSTGGQKAVRVSHANLLHNCGLLAGVCGAGAEARMASWLPFFHDWGLIGCVLYPVFAGGSCALMEPAEFLQRPRRWPEAIAAFGARVSCAPNFGYELAARAAADEDGASRPLDLSCWRMAMVGAEPVRLDTLDRFAAGYAPHGFARDAFYPCYGLAESTLIVTGGRRPAAPVHLALDRDALEAGRAVPVAEGGGGDASTARVFVGCGHPLGDQRVAITDPETGRPCPPMAIGEIRVSGPSVACGYHASPEETARTFVTEPGGDGDGSGRCWLRTGDLGFMAAEGLFVCGRLKDVVIKAGANYFAEEIELSAGRGHAALRPGCAAAFGIEIDGTERLVIVHEVTYGRRPALDAVTGAIQKAVSDDHGVLADAIALVAPGTLEKTSSGKIRRRHARARFLAGGLGCLTLWQSWPP